CAGYAGPHRMPAIRATSPSRGLLLDEVLDQLAVLTLNIGVSQEADGLDDITRERQIHCSTAPHLGGRRDEKSGRALANVEREVARIGSNPRHLVELPAQLLVRDSDVSIPLL